jgi:hypothetical protein
VCQQLPIRQLWHVLSYQDREIVRFKIFQQGWRRAAITCPDRFHYPPTDGGSTVNTQIATSLSTLFAHELRLLSIVANRLSLVPFPGRKTVHVEKSAKVTHLTKSRPLYRLPPKSLLHRCWDHRDRTMPRHSRQSQGARVVLVPLVALPAARVAKDDGGYCRPNSCLSPPTLEFAFVSLRDFNSRSVSCCTIRLCIDRLVMRCLSFGTHLTPFVANPIAIVCLYLLAKNELKVRLA